MLVFNARLPPSQDLKNYLAATFIIVHLDLATSIIHGSRLVTITDFRQIDIPQKRNRFKGLCCHFLDCVITIDRLQTISFHPCIRLHYLCSLNLGLLLTTSFETTPNEAASQQSRLVVESRIFISSKFIKLYIETE